MAVKQLFSVLFALTLFLPARAEEDSLHLVDKLFFEARGNFHNEFGGGMPHKGIFSGDYFNFNVSGHISPSVSYRIRQRLVKAAYNEHNIFNATDFLWINWQADKHFSFTFGKQPIYIGGYEYDSTPIDVYYWSKFSGGLYKVYSFGVSATYSFNPHQDLIFQFCESPLSNVTPNTFAWNLAWRGRLFPWWSTIWSVNLVEDEMNRFQQYAALGNRMFFGPVQFDLDLMTRETIGKTKAFSDWSVICKIIWSVGDWNICTKFGREANSSANIAADGTSYDIAVPAGSDFSYAGAGLEYFPRIKGRPVRLHTVWYWNTDGNSRHNFDIGITWWMRLK